MTTPSPDSPTGSASPRPGRRWYRRRPRGRGAVLGAALLALLVVGGVAAALLIPDGDRGDRRGFHGHGPDLGLTGEFGELSGTDELDASLSGDGPESRDGGWRDRSRGGGRGLGDDTLLVGTLTSTADGSIVVTPDGGNAPRAVRTDDDTHVRGSGNAALGDLAPGERVVVRVEGIGDAATAVAVLTPRTRVTGTVTALTGDSATVTRIDGLAVTANVAAVTPPAVGDLVVLTGVTTDGTTLTAQAIRVLPKAS